MTPSIDDGFRALVTDIKQYPWRVAPEVQVDESVFSMLSVQERKMLNWLARNLPIGDVCIVDAGCFLGGSTVALCRGLAGNPGLEKLGKIHVFDMFVAPRNQYSLHAIGNGRKPGDCVRDLFDSNVGEFYPFLNVKAGDVRQQAAPQQSIGLLFVDIAKDWDINDYVVKTLISKLVPKRSILIQQDYNDHSCPWINVTMQRFADHFEHLVDVGSSRVYLYNAPIPPDRLATPMRAEHSSGSILQLMDREIQTCGNSISHFFNLCTKSWLLFEFEGAEAAIAHLQAIASKQPWASPEPYVNIVINSILALRTAEGFKRHQQTYFERF